MKGIILAAGRGSRMKDRTKTQPKCMVELGGKPLLQWQLEAMQKGGVDDIAVVCGYLAHTLENLNMPVRYTPLLNPRWDQSNMLVSLLCAKEWAQDQSCIISYSDIVYPDQHVRSLLSSTAPLTMCYDTMWESLWRLRFADPLLDAESFCEKDGWVVDIGAKTQDIADIQGQYMGLLRINPEGWAIIEHYCQENIAKIDTLDMTGMFKSLLLQNIPIAAVPVFGRWCEVDNENDHDVYSNALQSCGWSHDWRDEGK